MFWLIMGISGVTCGGKTTLAESLALYFKDSINRKTFQKDIVIGKVHVIHQDDYFLPEDSPKHQWIESLNHINFDVISAFDMVKLFDDMKLIMGGYRELYTKNNITQLQQDMKDMRRYGMNLNQDTSITLNILILEGLLIFKDPFAYNCCQFKCHIHLPYEKCYARRKMRVYEPPDCIGYFELCVWPMYEKYVDELYNFQNIEIVNGEMTKEKCFTYVLNSLRKAMTIHL